LQEAADPGRLSPRRRIRGQPGLICEAAHTASARTSLQQALNFKRPLTRPTRQRRPGVGLSHWRARAQIPMHFPEYMGRMSAQTLDSILGVDTCRVNECTE
jgi:hypothetical protein